jgi:hypothetical protein
MMDPVNRALGVVRDAYKAAGYNVRALPPSLQVVRLISDLEVEVAQGGVLGWLINSSGPYGPDTVKAFEAVGAHQCASIVREILAFFPGGTPSFDDQERIRQINAVEDVAESHWRELGNRLLAWPDDIYVLLQKFIAEHEADFT